MLHSQQSAMQNQKLSTFLQRFFQGHISHPQKTKDFLQSSSTPQNSSVMNKSTLLWKEIFQLYTKCLVWAFNVSLINSCRSTIDSTLTSKLYIKSYFFAVFGLEDFSLAFFGRRGSPEIPSYPWGEYVRYTLEISVSVN